MDILLKVHSDSYRDYALAMHRPSLFSLILPETVPLTVKRALAQKSERADFYKSLGFPPSADQLRKKKIQNGWAVRGQKALEIFAIAG
jgi:hypothetical protein